MTQSKIEWTDRSDWNVIRGCTRESEGCRNCYAERIAGRFSDPGQPFHGIAERTKSGPRWTGKMMFVEERLDLPLRWRKPARIFVNSMFDLFHPDIPDDWIDRVFAVMALAPQHTFQVLTKRSSRMREYFAVLSRRSDRGISAELLAALYVGNPEIAKQWPLDAERAVSVAERGWPLPNVWLGISAEDQAHADERIPDLLATPAAKRFISAEPLLGPVKLRQTLGEDWLGTGKSGEPRGLDWVIVGGESSPDARPMHPDWARSLRDRCRAAGVPFFFKQWGEWLPFRQRAGKDSESVLMSPALGEIAHCGPGTLPERTDELVAMHRVGKRAAGRLLDGREWSEFPA